VRPLLFLMALLSPWLTGCQSRPKMGNLVALYTDFGLNDPYVGQLKGAVKTIHPGAELLDLSHDSSVFDVSVASYLLAKSTRTLPAGTVIIAVVDPGVGSDRAALAVRTGTGRIYVAPDNGILTEVLARDGLAEARLIENKDLFLPGEASSTFHGRDIFAPVAAHLAKGENLEAVGPKAEKLLRLPRNTATVMPNLAKGLILFIDHYGNILTNIPGSELAKLKVGQLLNLTIKGKAVPVPFLRTYAEAPDDRPFALVNSDGEFEIAIAKGNAAKKLGVAPGDPVVLKF
jgi:S-adenosylmethionine hydrolase